MNNKLDSFLKSDLLEKYILDDISTSERLMVEHYIETYPEVASQYNTRQKQLEVLANINAVEAPKHTLNTILEDVNKNSSEALTSKSSRSTKTSWLSIAASLVALICAGGFYLKSEQNKSLVNENQIVVDEIRDLRNDIEDNNKRLDNLMLQFMKLSNPETQKYVFRGKDRSKDLKTVAYINPIEETSMIDIVSLPQLPEDQAYMLWAKMQDRMINLGILDDSKKKLQSVPYVKDAIALSISIGSRERQREMSVDSTIAQIDFKE